MGKFIGGIIMAKEDLEPLREALNATLESWLPRLLPGGVILRRKEFAVGSAAGEAGQSLRVCLAGPKRGLWQDRATGEGGDAFALLQACLGTDFTGALKVAREIGGMQLPATREVPVVPVGTDNRCIIEDVLRYTLPIRTGCVSDRYLLSRGLTVRSADVVHRVNLIHWPTKSHWPAMVARVRNINGDVVGVHRIYLTPGGMKAPISPNKMMLGTCAGGAVRLGHGTSAPHLGICEGIETGLAVLQKHPELDVWATLSTSGMRSVDIPALYTKVTIFADFDERIDRPGTPHHGQRPGTMAAEALMARLEGEGRLVQILYPRDCINDFNDELMADSNIQFVRSVECPT